METYLTRRAGCDECAGSDKERAALPGKVRAAIRLPVRRTASLCASAARRQWIVLGGNAGIPVGSVVRFDHTLSIAWKVWQCLEFRMSSFSRLTLNRVIMSQPLTMERAVKTATFGQVDTEFDTQSAAGLNAAVNGGRNENASLDDLAQIVAAWPRLPGPIRRAMLALIK